MQFKLIIDKEAQEEIVVTAHQRCALTDQIEALVSGWNPRDRLPVYLEDDMILLPFTQMECITIIDGKTYAIDTKRTKYRLKQRLYELEPLLPPYFIRINKSTFANENRLERFAANFSGAVDAVFKCGYRDYVSRRCFSVIKRRYNKK